jgi:hypothetical protein
MAIDDMETLSTLVDKELYTRRRRLQAARDEMNMTRSSYNTKRREVARQQEELDYWEQVGEVTKELDRRLLGKEPEAKDDA